MNDLSALFIEVAQFFAAHRYRIVGLWTIYEPS